MAQLSIAELDFDGIKANLKAFLQQQEEFSDYNFDGAGLSVLLDLLAYNTHYNASLTHLLSNEMFIDSAIKRSSAVSIAKSLGYMPTSTRSASTNATVTVVPPSSYTGKIAVIPRFTEFKASNAAGGTFSFFPLTTTYADYINGRFSFSVKLVQGKKASQSFAIAVDNVSGPLKLSNKNVDTTSILVRVKKSASQEVYTKWEHADNILDVDGESEVYFIEESGDGRHELRFGDGVLGKKLSAGNIVIVEYLISAGQEANSASSFSTSTTFTDVGESVAVTAPKASGGAARQDLDSIRFIAPKFNATKNRAVTADDYQALIYSRYPNINSITIWGGEDNDPPIYGKVFVSIEPLPGSFVTQQDKDVITKEVLEPRGVVGIQPVFVDPEYTYISLDVTARYNTRKSALSATQIKNEINNQINTYFVNDVAKRKKNFYYSELLEDILQTTRSVYSANMEVTVHKRHTPALGASNTLDFKYATALRPGTLRSSNFTTILAGGAKVEVYIKDSYTEENINTLNIHKVSDDSIVSYSAGTVDYTTGRVKFPSLVISSLSGTATTFRVYAKTKYSSPDIIVGPIRNTTVSDNAVMPTASKNSVIAKDATTPDTASGFLRGINITVVGTDR